MSDLEQEHDLLVEQLKKKCGQASSDTIIGLSIKDCLDDSDKSPLMRKILEIRAALERK